MLVQGPRQYPFKFFLSEVDDSGSQPGRRDSSVTAAEDLGPDLGFWAFSDDDSND